MLYNFLTSRIYPDLELNPNLDRIPVVLRDSGYSVIGGLFSESRRFVYYQGVGPSIESVREASREDEDFLNSIRTSGSSRYEEFFYLMCNHEHVTLIWTEKTGLVRVSDNFFHIFCHYQKI